MVRGYSICAAYQGERSLKEPFRCTELQGLARCGCVEVPSKPCAGYAHWAPNQERWVERSRATLWTQQGSSQESIHVELAAFWQSKLGIQGGQGGLGSGLMEIP